MWLHNGDSCFIHTEGGSGYSVRVSVQLSLARYLLVVKSKLCVGLCIGVCVCVCVLVYKMKGRGWGKGLVRCDNIVVTYKPHTYLM